MARMGKDRLLTVPCEHCKHDAVVPVKPRSVHPKYPANGRRKGQEAAASMARKGWPER